MTNNYISEIDKVYYENTYGTSEEITEDNFHIPSEEDYVSSEEVYHEESEVEEWDISEAKPGLWENIRKKKEREGDDNRPAKKGDPDRPDPESWKKAQKPKKKSKSGYKYENPRTGEVFTYVRKGIYKKDGVNLVYKGKAAEYQGRKVKLGKPFRTPDGPKKFSVYLKNDK